MGILSEEAVSQSAPLVPLLRVVVVVLIVVVAVVVAVAV